MNRLKIRNGIPGVPKYRFLVYDKQSLIKYNILNKMR